MTTFSAQAWEETASLYGRILDLPFNRELAAGTLSPERFRFYMIQDSLYLKEYARVLSIASAKAPDTDGVEFFAKSAETVVVVERALHGGFLEKFGVTETQLNAAEPSPSCLGYTNFLLATAAHDGYAELVAAVLPCFWIYWEVGKHIAGSAASDNPYQSWIDTYAGDEFGDAVQTAIAISDRAAADAAPAVQDTMMRAYKRCAQYEWMFWDSAYRQEAWPVAAE